MYGVVNGQLINGSETPAGATEPALSVTLAFGGLNGAPINATSLNGCAQVVGAAPSATHIAVGIPPSRNFEYSFFSSARIFLGGTPAVVAQTSQAPATQFGYPTLSGTIPAGIATGLSPAPFFGRPLATQHLAPRTSLYLVASSFRPTRFGTPACTSRVDLLASGFSCAGLGAPVAAQGLDVQPWAAPTHFGMPNATALRTLAPQGWDTTNLGVPSVNQGLFATALFTPASFGSATVGLHNRCTAVGAYVTKFGLTRNDMRYRALHIPPPTRLGKPLLRRSLTC